MCFGCGVVVMFFWYRNESRENENEYSCGMGCGKCTELGQMEKAPFPCCAVQKRMLYFYIHSILSRWLSFVLIFFWLSGSHLIQYPRKTKT